MYDGCIEPMTILYQKSNIPVVIFDDEMNTIWTNNRFQQYFSEESEKPLALTTLTDTPFKDSLSASTGFTSRIQISLNFKHKLSVDFNLLVFPVDNLQDKPSIFIGYIDDITDERNMMLRKTYMGLLEASKLKDNDTGNHIKRVGAYAKRFSEELFRLGNYDEVTLDFIENIHFLAPMHDVGKIGTPDDILNKKGSLDESEWVLMKEHTINGALILSNYPGDMARAIARSHHERWDGSGYPFGLYDDDIPLAARITAIADVYDALRMKRSYKEAFSHEKTIEIIKKSSGTHFDPSLVEVFYSVNEFFNGIFEALADDNVNDSDQDIEELVPIDGDEELEELEGL